MLLGGVPVERGMARGHIRIEKEKVREEVEENKKRKKEKRLTKAKR